MLTSIEVFRFQISKIFKKQKRGTFRVSGYVAHFVKYHIITLQMTGLKKNAETEHLQTPFEASLYQSLREAKNTLVL